MTLFTTGNIPIYEILRPIFTILYFVIRAWPIWLLGIVIYIAIRLANKHSKKKDKE